jgi:hypothetical protein
MSPHPSQQIPFCSNIMNSSLFAKGVSFDV